MAANDAEIIHAFLMMLGALVLAGLVGAAIGWISGVRKRGLFWLILALPSGIGVFFAAAPYMILTASVPEAVVPESDGTATGVVAKGLFVFMAASFLAILKTVVAAFGGALAFIGAFFLTRHLRYSGAERSTP